jgi:hypothetical protein
MPLPGYRPGGIHPQSSGLRNILAFYGTRAPHTGEPYTEAMVFGIAGGLGVSHWTWEFKGRPPMATIFFRNMLERDEGFFRRACARLKVPVELFESRSATKATAALQQMLGDRKAGLAWLDLASLPYQLQPPELVTWFGHEAVVCGYDAPNDCYELDDRAPRAWHVEAQTLAKARAAITSNKHRLAIAGRPTEYPDLSSAVEAGIRDCVEAMLSPPIKNLGLPALEKWAGLVKHPRDKKGWPTVFPPGPALFEALASTYSSIVCAGTGGDALRGLYADFLDEARTVSGRDEYGEAAEIFRLSGRLWRRLAKSLLPDDVGPLRKTRSLLNTNRRLFEGEGAPVLPGIRANIAELDGLRRQVEQAFPMSVERTQTLLDSLAEQLLAIHEVESEAVSRLEATLPPA